MADYSRRILPLALLMCMPFSGFAQTAPLTDRNGDGAVSIICLGDSITYGVGDGTAPGTEVEEIPFTDGTLGYPSRLQTLLQIPVTNAGVPGEIFSEEGIASLPSRLIASSADTVLLMEGANDAVIQVSASEYQRNLQKAVNAVRALGKEIAVFTITPSTADHAGLRPGSARYSDVIRELALVNDYVLVDVERAWETSCLDPASCELFNLPEGLHPNRAGYDVIAQSAAAAVLGIDIFAEGGAADLAAATGIDPALVLVRPDLSEAIP